MTIPTAALDSLLMAVEEAVRLAQDGDPAAGYEVLLTGRARALEGERNFEPWAEELEGRWDRAVERFAERHGSGGREATPRPAPMAAARRGQRYVYMV